MLLAAVLAFSTFVLNVGAIEAIKWPVINYNTGEITEYETFTVSGTIAAGRSEIAFNESNCYEIRVAKTGYYLLDCNCGFDFDLSVSVKDGKVEEFVWLSPDLRGEEDGSENRFLWLEAGHSYYLHIRSLVDNNYSYSLNLIFLGEIVSAELETETFYVDGDILHDDFLDKYCDTPYKIETGYKISFSGGYTARDYGRSVIIDSLTPGKHTLTLNVFNGHGPEFEVNLIDTGDQIDHIEVPDKDYYLYALVAEDGSIRFRYWPACIRVYFKDGSVIDVPGVHDPTTTNMSDNHFTFTQPDGTQVTVHARYEVDEGWMNKTLYQALDDAINKTFDPTYEDPLGNDSVWFVAYLENKQIPAIKEKTYFDKYMGESRNEFIGAVMSFIALPYFALLKAVCNILPLSLQDALCASVMHYYFKYML